MAVHHYRAVISRIKMAAVWHAFIISHCRYLRITHTLFNRLWLASPVNP